MPDSRDPAEVFAEIRLSDQERAILRFEQGWWREPGTKQVAIRREFNISPTSYYRVLSELIEDPAALAYDPLTVLRLRRLRDIRRRTRIEGVRHGHPGGAK